MKLFVLLILLLGVYSLARAQQTLPTDTEILAGYQQLIDTAKKGGYNGHTSDGDRDQAGIKPYTLNLVIGNIGVPPTNRNERIHQLAEVLYSLRTNGVEQYAKYDPPTIIKKEGRDVEISGGLLSPPSINDPNGKRSKIDWVWRLRLTEGGDWRIVWISYTQSLRDPEIPGFGRDSF